MSVCRLAAIGDVPQAKRVKEIQIVNGRTPGNITKALAGEHVGTIIHTD